MKKGSFSGWLMCVAAASLVCACHEKEDGEAAAPPQVKTFHLMRQKVTDRGEWFGYLRGKRDTDIRPHVTGFLQEQVYEDGAKVKKGDVLFRIDSAVFEAELELAKANMAAALAQVKSAQAAMEQAKKDVERYSQLVNNGAVSEKDLDDALHRLRASQAAVDTANAAVLQNKAAVEKAQINLDYTTVCAPYDGIIGTAQASKGDLVSPATMLANITSVDPIRIEFSINSDRLINAFRKYGDPSTRAESKLPPPPPADIVLEDGSIFPYKGKLLAMESKVGESGLINVEGEVENPDAILRGGMPVRVRVPISQREALLVPQEAIRSVLRSDFIIVVDNKQEPHMVPVVVQGEYEVDVSEDNGYHSKQKMLAVSGYNGSLEHKLQELGYDDPAQALVVVDEQNAVHAMNISSANSRLQSADAPRGKVAPVAFSYKPEPLSAVAAARDTEAGQQPEAPAAKPTLPQYVVKVSPLRQRDVAVMDEWFGTLRGVEETDIRSQVTGFVLKQHFKDGSMVKQGDVLYTIDPASFEASVAEARANLLMAESAVEQAQAQLDRCMQDYARYNKLKVSTPGAISDKTLTDAESAIKTNRAELLKAKASVKQMEAALRLAEINLGYTEVRAPFDGRAGIHKVSEGALVSPTDAQPLVTLSSVNPMRVDFKVSGKGALQGIAAFQAENAREMPGFDVVLEDGSLYPVKGHVVSADNALQKSTGTLRVVGHVENVDGGLRSGMPVRVRAGLTPQKGAFLVPARAPLNAQGRDVVALLKPDNTPVLLPVTLGELVTLPVADEPGGKETPQPMQIIDVDRKLVEGMMLAHTKAADTATLALQGAGVQDWQEFALKVAGVQDFRALAEKINGAKLPDDAPAQMGVEDWSELAMKKMGADSPRELALRLAHAADELDIIARAQGYQSVLEMALKHIGFENVDQVRVIAEGAMPAAQVYQANEQAGAAVNTLKAVPFLYRPPRTVVESVTAEPDTSEDSQQLPHTSTDEIE